jgi:hypothetical protein
MTSSSGIGSEQQHYSGRRPIHGSDHERRSACWQEGKAERFLVCVLQTPVLGRGIRGAKNSAASRFAWHLVYRVFFLIQNRCAAWKKKLKKQTKTQAFSLGRWWDEKGLSAVRANCQTGRQAVSSTTHRYRCCSSCYPTQQGRHRAMIPCGRNIVYFYLAHDLSDLLVFTELVCQHCLFSIPQFMIIMQPFCIYT